MIHLSRRGLPFVIIIIPTCYFITVYRERREREKEGRRAKLGLRLIKLTNQLGRDIMYVSSDERRWDHASPIPSREVASTSFATLTGFSFLVLIFWKEMGGKTRDKFLLLLATVKRYDKFSRLKKKEKYTRVRSADRFCGICNAPYLLTSFPRSCIE